jgi:hypothetical protein
MVFQGAVKIALVALAAYGASLFWLSSFCPMFRCFDAAESSIVSYCRMILNTRQKGSNCLITVILFEN